MTGERSEIVDATDWPPAEWDRLAVRSPRGHAFQSHAWGELKRSLGWRPLRYVIEQAGTPVAVVAVQERAIGPFGWPSFLYASRGPVLLSPTADAARVSLTGLRHVAAARRAAILTCDPLWTREGEVAGELPRAAFRPAARDVQVSRTAMIVPLAESEEEQHRLLRKSTASLINRARRGGAVAERIDLTAGSPAERDAAFDEMHDLFAATARREGMILRDRAYQLAQWRALGAAGIASLWFAKVDGRRWVGSVTLHCGDTLFQFQAGSADDADLRAVPVNHLLQWEILRWAAGAGFATYDLGGVDAPGARGIPRDESHPLWNLYLFKHGFGAQPAEYARAHEFVPNRLFRFGWQLARRWRSGVSGPASGAG